jgi:hypothetical protein
VFSTEIRLDRICRCAYKGAPVHESGAVSMPRKSWRSSLLLWSSFLLPMGLGLLVFFVLSHVMREWEGRANLARSCLPYDVADRLLLESERVAYTNAQCITLLKSFTSRLEQVERGGEVNGFCTSP